MKNLNILSLLLLSGLFLMVSCNDDDDDDDDMTPEPEQPTAAAGNDATVDLEKTVTLNGAASVGTGLVYAWVLTAPDGSAAALTGGDTASPTFVASQEGTYVADLMVTNADGNSATDMVSVVVENPTYALEDQMGRPAINTVFNFFGDADTKNGYNSTLPADGSANATAFEGILDALQGYIGLDSDTYANVLGLDNTTTATVLSTDVLNCNKSAATTYGPSDLSNITVFENVLNGRGLSNDVVDVTLILTFAGDDLANLSDLQSGLIGDGVAANDVSFSTDFPYLADPH
ncbi:MAG: DUF4331 family protein [Cyclobacteriaceae bacterium]